MAAVTAESIEEQLLENYGSDGCASIAFFVTSPYAVPADLAVYVANEYDSIQRATLLDAEHGNTARGLYISEHIRNALDQQPVFVPINRPALQNLADSMKSVPPDMLASARYLRLMGPLSAFGFERGTTNRGGRVRLPDDMSYHEGFQRERWSLFLDLDDRIFWVNVSRYEYVPGRAVYALTYVVAHKSGAASTTVSGPHFVPDGVGLVEIQTLPFAMIFGNGRLELRSSGEKDDSAIFPASLSVNGSDDDDDALTLHGQLQGRNHEAYVVDDVKGRTHTVWPHLVYTPDDGGGGEYPAWLEHWWDTGVDPPGYPERFSSRASRVFPSRAAPQADDLRRAVHASGTCRLVNHAVFWTLQGAPVSKDGLKEHGTGTLLVDVIDDGGTAHRNVRATVIMSEWTEQADGFDYPMHYTITIPDYKSSLRWEVRSYAQVADGAQVGHAQISGALLTDVVPDDSYGYVRHTSHDISQEQYVLDVGYDDSFTNTFAWPRPTSRAAAFVFLYYFVPFALLFTLILVLWYFFWKTASPASPHP